MAILGLKVGEHGLGRLEIPGEEGVAHLLNPFAQLLGDLAGLLVEAAGADEDADLEFASQ